VCVCVCVCAPSAGSLAEAKYDALNRRVRIGKGAVRSIARKGCVGGGVYVGFVGWDPFPPIPSIPHPTVSDRFEDFATDEFGSFGGIQFG
jgi:hypothetical protein